jgi:N utilization substance protein B
MSIRRDNRVAAMQFLYQWDINRSDHLQEDLRVFFENQEHPPKYFVFAESLILGAIEHIAEVDEVIKRYAQNWDFSRIAKVDLAILRLAIFEMLHRNDIPPVVSINEGIDLSKVFSTDDSRRFINGILDQFKLTLTRPLRDARK